MSIQSPILLISTNHLSIIFSREKASTNNAIASTLREKLPTDVKQFKAYFVALVADKEHSKVLDSIARVDESF
jgi:hypothetical protein